MSTYTVSAKRQNYYRALVLAWLRKHHPGVEEALMELAYKTFPRKRAHSTRRTLTSEELAAIGKIK